MFSFRIVPESVPWLIANGRLQQAENIIRTGAKISNKRQLPSIIFVEKEETLKNKRLKNADKTNNHYDVNTDEQNNMAMQNIVQDEIADTAAEQRESMIRSSTTETNERYKVGLCDIFKSSTLTKFILILAVIW